MEDNFQDIVKSKSTESLKNIAINFTMHRGALVAAAKKELENREVEFSDEEKQKIEDNRNQRKQSAIDDKESKKSWDWFNAKWKINIVDDINAPQLYSRQVINVFSILFSVLFGGILLSINLKSVNNKKAIFPVLFFSMVYTSVMIFILNLIPGSTSLLTIMFNLVGAAVLYNFFWGKYIGKEFQYRTKQFWIPLIIGIMVTSFSIWAIIAGNKI